VTPEELRQGTRGCCSGGYCQRADPPFQSRDTLLKNIRSRIHDSFKRPEKPKDAPDSQQSSSSVSQDGLKDLLELLSNKDTSEVDQSEIDSFIQNLKNLTDSNEGTLIDQKA
jgi:mannitol-1-phosphate/altronate dehydrogenase